MISWLHPFSFIDNHIEVGTSIRNPVQPLLTCTFPVVSSGGREGRGEETEKGREKTISKRDKTILSQEISSKMIQIRKAVRSFPYAVLPLTRRDTPVKIYKPNPVLSDYYLAYQLFLCFYVKGVKLRNGDLSVRFLVQIARIMASVMKILENAFAHQALWGKHVRKVKEKKKDHVSMNNFP